MPGNILAVTSVRRTNEVATAGFPLGSLLIAQLIAFWPVMQWYASRIGDGSDEPWGVLALLTAVVFAVKHGRRESKLGMTPVALTLAYVLLFPLLPPLGRAMIAACALASLSSSVFYGRAFHSGMFSLLMLSLPLIPTAQFYLGYPLRALTAVLISEFLQLAGMNVVQQGAMLTIGQHAVWIDAPCSGIKMFWTGSYVVACLLSTLSFSARRAMALSIVAALAIFIANLSRCALLFFLEVYAPDYPAWWHSATGIFAFLGAATIICAAGLALRRDRYRVPGTNRSRRNANGAALLIAAQLTAAIVPFTYQRTQPVVIPHETRWPATFEGVELREEPLSWREAKFAADFPGAIKRFKAGSKELVIRQVNQPTRKLHPSSDCLRGVGYRVTPLPAIVSGDEHWSCALATKFSEAERTTLKVCDVIRDSKGRSWADVSNWYWSAVWNGSTGPWTALTVVEKAHL